MSIALVEAYYRAFNAGDPEGMLALVSDDVVHDINQGDRELGKTAFRAFLARMNQAYREQLAELVVMADATGTRFAAEFLVHGEYLQADPGFPAAHGQRYTLPAGAFLAVRGGAICRVSTYYNLAEWLRQVGSAA
jgi:steroid delta-isomerase-like uncharacterized protein